MADNSYLNVAIDLGTESVKIVCAYKTKDGKVKRLFLTDQDDPNNQPFSSLALYQGPPQSKWVFGQDINKKDDYANIIRVKEMLYLLASKNEADKDYYENKRKFPIFIFPPRPDQPSIKNGMSQLDEDGYTFEAVTTPQEMAREFFKALFEKCIKNQTKKILSSNPHLEGIKYISIFPDPKMKEDYKNELVDLIAYGAGIDDIFDKKSLPIVSMSTPQAIAIGAYVEKMIKANDYSNDDNKTLIFDIGERNISVAKVDVKNSVSGKQGEISICVDGVDENESECAIGGTDIDVAIGEYVKRKTEENLPKGEKSSIVQDYMSYRQQYRLLRHVKSAKKGFLYFDQAYVLVEKSINYEIPVTKDEFVDIIFNNGNAVGEKIANYIISVLERQGNENVKNVLLVGGGAASYHLRDYIEEKCSSEENAGRLGHVVISATDNDEDKLSEYFSAIGAAMLEPSGLLLKVVSAYTYGTSRIQYVPVGGTYKEERVFTIWINRGDEISSFDPTPECVSKAKFSDSVFRYPYRLNRDVYYAEEDERNHNYEAFIYREPLVLGNPESKEFKRAQEKGVVTIGTAKIKLAIMLDGKKVPFEEIYSKYPDQPYIRSYIENINGVNYEYLGLNKRSVFFKQGARISSNGRVTPYYEIDVDRTKKMNNGEFYVNIGKQKYGVEYFTFDGKLDPFTPETN
ncbi:MAG: hypothetical protein IJA82_03905 [Clostridia bacterium]|nr:hypothetical protein [Clostridia bacterium]